MFAALIIATTIAAAPPVSPPPASAVEVPAAAQAAPDFDVMRATDAYLALMPPDRKARSDAYFEGGYWIQLWSVLLTFAVMWALLTSGWSAAMRDRAARLTRVPALQSAAYWIQFAILTAAATFPFTLYTDYFREHQYGLATQTIGPWLGDQAKQLAVILVVGSPVVTALYAVLRRVGRSWWVWATAVVMLFSVVVVALGPVYIAPLFNRYTRLEDPRIREPILRMARANGIKADAVYVVDQSRQTTRISANVSGMLGTERISLNDNLLRRAPLEEIEAVLGHEMGHYVLNHVVDDLVETALVVAVGFAIVAVAFERLRRRHSRWGIAGVSDPAGLPLLVLLFSVFQFVATPVTNTIIRTHEYEADIFGLNASGQPDGFAHAALDLGEYRKMSPGPVEEFVFFDHPSGRTRIRSAMRWKAEHLH
jgi:STE24 endopeptidase